MSPTGGPESPHYCHLIFVALINVAFLTVKCATEVPKASGGSEKAEFILHPNKLDGLFHRAATMALLKAKARETLEAVPSQLERIVFGECVKDGGTQSPAKYAKCLVKLFRARDSWKRTRMEEGEGKQQEEEGQEEGIFGGTMNLLATWAKELARKKIDQKPANKAVKVNSGPKQILKLTGRKKGKQEEKRKKWLKKLQKFRKKISRKGRRRTRREMKPSAGGDKLPKNMRALKTLQAYLDRLEWAQRYLKGMSQESARALKPFLKQPIDFVESSSAVLPLLSQIQSILNGSNSNRPDLSFSLLSPRLLSLFPPAKGKPKLLSPDIFSFSRDGFLPLPQLFGMISPDEKESMEWLDFVLDLSGAGKQLAGLLEKMRPEMEEFEGKLWPALERLRAEEEHWKRLKTSLNGKQQKELAERGFAHLEGWQQEMLLGKVGKKRRKKGALGLEQKIEQLAKLADLKRPEGRRARRQTIIGEEGKKPEEKLEEKLEEKPEEKPEGKVEEEKRRTQRQELVEEEEEEEDDEQDVELNQQNVVTAEGVVAPLPAIPPNFFNGPPLPLPLPPPFPLFPPPPCPVGSCVISGVDSNGEVYMFGGPSPDTEDGIYSVPRTVLLTPWAFENRLGGVILEGVYLSPHAFYSELVSPEVLTLKVASPSAFVAAILSPMALTARIVSPTAFRSQILSPEALSAYVLSPDVFLAEILSPNVMQTRILSPKLLFLQILNPMIASPRIGSPQVGGLVVLSPNFLSPRFYSQESLQVEVLSPHILGGEHDVTESDRWTPDGATHYVGFPPQPFYPTHS